jgi:RNA polymerase subunit RPABC4/transcription elongation factor Spt4
MEYMVCSSCGTNIDDSLEYCPNCSIRNENYKNPFISSNSDIGNIASSDSFSSTSIDSTLTEEIKNIDENNSLDPNIDNTKPNLENQANISENTLPPINISTPSSEVFKMEDSNTHSLNDTNNISQSSDGKLPKSEEISVDKKKLSKKNKILIIGGVVILVIIVFSLFLLNTLFAKSPQYIILQMLQKESSLKESHIKYNLNVDGNYKYSNSSYSTIFNLQGSLNIQNGSSGIVKYDGINSVLGSIKSPYLGANFNIDLSIISEYYKNKEYFEFTKFQPQLYASLLKLHLNSWEEINVQRNQVNNTLDYKLPNLKNIKIKEIKNTTINNIPVTEYSVLLDRNLIKSSLSGILKTYLVNLNKSVNLYLWINTTNYYLYKLAFSTSIKGENINFNVVFSNINKPFNITVPTSYSHYIF